MPVITISALDTFYFRDGKPFQMGEDTISSGIFPPFPSVLYGILRSAYFAENMDEFSLRNIAEDPTKALKITQICLKNESNELLFPLPNDLITAEDESLHLLKLEENTLISSTITPMILSSPIAGKTQSNAGNYLSLSALNRYLNTPNLPIALTNIQSALSTDSKIGIGRNTATHTAEEGKLYRINFQRLKGKTGENTHEISLCVEYDGIAIAEKGLLRVGAEGKGASYALLEPEIQTQVSCPALTRNRFKMYVSSPAIFMEGWLPKFLFNAEGITLLTAAMGKPVSIGGYDMKTQTPKVMNKAVSGGSVYYLEAETQEKAQDFAKKYHGTSLSDKYKEQGFGIVYFGNI